MGMIFIDFLFLVLIFLLFLNQVYTPFDITQRYII